MMRNLLSVLLLVVIVFGCENNTKSNLELINQIDSIKNVTVTYKLEVDSEGSFLDSVSIEKKKVSDSQKVVYEENKIFKGDGFIKIINYYSDNENLIYSKTYSNELGIISISEFWENDSLITKGQSIGFKNNIAKDTISIDYNYIFNPNNLLENLNISSKLLNEKEYGNLTSINYDENGRVTSEYLIQKNDTLRETNYKYEQDNLKVKSIIDYNEGLLRVLEYDKNGYIVQEELFKESLESIVKTMEQHYTTDSKGQILKIDIVALPSGIKKFYIFKRVKNPTESKDIKNPEMI